MNTQLRTISMALALSVTSATALGCGGGSSNDAATTSNDTATTTSTTGGDAAQSEPGFPMPLPRFLEAVTIEVLPQLCSEASPLRTCYPSIDAELCANAFGTAMMLCGENMQSTLPAEVTEENADPVATAVATCARMAYQAGLEQAGVVRAADCSLAR